MMNEYKFKVGDIAQLKSDGVLMTVKHREEVRVEKKSTTGETSTEHFNADILKINQISKLMKWS